MQIGMCLPVSGSWARPDVVRHIAVRAEELGYQSLWTFQRLLTPADPNAVPPVYQSVLDPLVALGYAAAATRRMRLGVAIINIPFVSPPLLAKQVATLDVLSDGRADVGVGQGWLPEEFTASSTSMRARGPRLEEYIAAIKALWTTEVVDFDGYFYSVPPARAEPKPVQRPHPPVLIGATADAALRRAGRIGDGWVSASRHDVSRLGRAIEIVKGAAREAGRDPETLRFVCRAALRGGERKGPLTGDAEQVRTDLADIAAQGVTELFLDLNFNPAIGHPAADPDESSRLAERTMTELAPT